MGQIRSKLVTFAVRAIDPDTDETVNWTITLQGNRIPEDRADWLKDARKYYRDITLTRVTAAQKAQTAAIQTKAEIAAEGLKILDSIVAGRNGQTS